MSTLNVSNINNAAASSGGISIDAGGLVTGGIPTAGRNHIVNGGCLVWQRGTSGLSTSDGYKMDMLRVNTGTTTRSTDVPSGLGFTYSASITGVTNGVVIVTPVELPAAGVAGPYTGTWTYSFYGKWDSGKTIYLSAWFANASAGGNQATIIDYNPPSAGIPFVGTGAWERYSHTFTFPVSPAGTNTTLRLTLLNLTSGFSLTGFNMTGIQLERGSIATAFEHKKYADDLQECQRYYYQSSDNVTSAAWYALHGGLWVDAEDFGSGGCSFPVTMRANPTVVLYVGASTGVIKSTNTAGQTNRNVSSLTVTKEGVGSAFHDGGYSVGRPFRAQFTASAEL